MQEDDTTQEKIDRCPPALQAIIEDFRTADPRERLDYLLEYAMSLPALPARSRPSATRWSRCTSARRPSS